MKRSLKSLVTLVSTFFLCLSPTFFYADSLGHSTDSLNKTMNSEIGNVTKNLKENVLQHVITLAAIVGFIICAVSAAGGNVGQMVLNNIGYVLFLVFGSSIVIAFVEKFNTFTV